MNYNRQDKKQLKDDLKVEFGRFFGLDGDTDVGFPSSEENDNNEHELIALHQEMSKSKSKKKK